MFQWSMVQPQVRIVQLVRAGTGVPMVDGSNPGQDSSTGQSWDWCSNG